MIDKGNYYLINACEGNEVSKYHLEAGVAYWHTASTNENKWKRILELYNQLILIEYSPITALNRVFAFSKVYGKEESIPEAMDLNLSENNFYHGLLGYLYAGLDIRKAIEHYKKAIGLTKSKTEKKTLAKEIERLKAVFAINPLE